MYDARPAEPEPMRRHAGDPIPGIGVVQPYIELRELHVNPARALRAILDWSRRYRPEFVVSNLRPGLPCWLAWAAVNTEVPLVAVATSAQLERSPSDVLDGINDLWLSAGERILAATVEQRDEAVVSRCATVVTIGTIMGQARPTLGRPGV